MRPGKGGNGRRRRTSSSSSPVRERPLDFDGPTSSGHHRSRVSPPKISHLDRELVTEEVEHCGFLPEYDRELVTEEVEHCGFLPEYYYENNNEWNPRSFPCSVKQQCWEKAEKIKGRDPDRWRRDALGNVVFRKLVGSPGCLGYDYDHIIPYSKGGKSTVDNCQVLQATVNRSKGNRTEISKADLIQKSAYCRVSGRDMDRLEHSAYGNVHRGQDSRGCSSQ